MRRAPVRSEPSKATRTCILPEDPSRFGYEPPSWKRAAGLAANVEFMKCQQ